MLVTAFGVLLFAVACQRKHTPWLSSVIFFEYSPQPPRAGSTTVAIVIKDPKLSPVVGAYVNFEADMSHPGMAPVFAVAKEVKPGRYESTLTLGMAGDWVILVHGSLPSGEKLERQFDLKGVRPN